MSNMVVPQIYRWVIDDVVTNISAQLGELGLDDQTINEMQATWERKLVETRSANYGPPNFDAQLGSQGRTPSYNQQQQTMSPHLQYRTSIPQYDGANDYIPPPMPQPSTQDDSIPMKRKNTSPTRGRSVKKSHATTRRASSVPSSTSETFDSRILSEPYIGIPQHDGDDDGNLDNEIGSDLDDDEEIDDEVGLDHTILSLYEKVSRVKNKWKCSFKDGIVMVNGKDYVYSKATCDFEW